MQLHQWILLKKLHLNKQQRNVNKEYRRKKQKRINSRKKKIKKRINQQERQNLKRSKGGKQGQLSQRRKKNRKNEIKFQQKLNKEKINNQVKQKHNFQGQQGQLIKIFEQNLQQIKTRKFYSNRFIHRSEIPGSNQFYQKPFLIDCRKFDLRIYVLLNHELNFYMFKQGYARFSSQRYTVQKKDIANQFIHLTNNSIQKYSKKYGQKDNGNMQSFNDIKNYISQHNTKVICIKQIDFHQDIINSIKQIIIISMKSIAKKLNNKRKFCSEIFGYDFILDQDGKPWLLQVNTNPDFEQNSDLLVQLLPRMIHDAFRLTIDHIFPIPSQGYSNCPFRLFDYKDSQNLFQYLGNLIK